MSASQSTLNISGVLSQSAGGSINYNAPQLVNLVGSYAQSYELALTTSPQLVTLPTGTIFFAITPPPSNTISISFKFLNGDTGGKVSEQYGIPCLGVDPSQLTFYVWAAAPVTVQITSA